LWVLRASSGRSHCGVFERSRDSSCFCRCEFRVCRSPTTAKAERDQRCVGLVLAYLDSPLVCVTGRSRVTCVSRSIAGRVIVSHSCLSSGDSVMSSVPLSVGVVSLSLGSRRVSWRTVRHGVVDPVLEIASSGVFGSVTCIGVADTVTRSQETRCLGSSS